MSSRKFETAAAAISALLMAGSLAACGGSRNPTKDPCVGENCEGADQISYCGRDSECASDEFCDGGTCQPRNDNRPDNACASHDDCTAGLLCNVVTGRCVECLNEDHCDPGLVCRADGTCGQDSGCATNADCGALRCNTTTHACVQCLSSGDCPASQTCRNNQCYTDGGTAPVCTTQTDCDAYGKICDTSGHCVACTTPAQCGTGRTCTNGACVSTGGTTDGTCTTSADCGGQACFLSMCMPCFSDFMCISLEDLLTGVSKICDPMTGNCGDPQCQIAEHCPAGQGCYSGHCGACLDDAECRAGENCDADTGVCSAAAPTTCTTSAQCTDGRVCVSNACVDCTSTPQCGPDLQCVTGRCTTVTPPPPPGTMGATCAGADSCNAGLTCVTDGATSTSACTRTCIGSGKGGDADCPLGWACVNYDSGPLDGVMMCESAAMLPTDYPGQPFTQAPDDSCASGNACQTSICYSDNSLCARGCAANRDCSVGEVCYALVGSDGKNTGFHFCFYSDTTNYRASGAACNNAVECDSGLCVGQCSDGKSCNSNTDCASGTCNGFCRDHCRSNADCGSGLACNAWPTNIGATQSSWVPTCMPKFYTGSKLDGAACTDDSQCASDWCINSVCNTPCAITADCTGALAGRHCQALTFIDANQNPVYSMAFCK